jgi:hypothetical protein
VCKQLALTREIQASTRWARDANRKLWICCMPVCSFTAKLKNFVNENDDVVVVYRTESIK